MSSKKFSNQVFKQLARNNVKNSLKDYAIYFVTLVFGVILLYTFNSISDNINFLSGNELLEASLNMAKGIIFSFSIVIVVIFGYLVNYANQFIMSRRKKEFGIYITLGMDKKDINKIMFKESLIIGIFSLVIGMLFGIFISQGLNIIVLKILGASESVIAFSVSISSIIKTIVFFGSVMILVNILNKRSIKKYTLIELLQSDKKNEEFIAKNKSSNIKLFFLSTILIIVSYIILLKVNMSTKILMLCLGLISVGTYLLFISISDFIINKIKKHKKIYYKNLNTFIISQIASRIKTTSLSITVICLVLFLSTIIMPFGMSFGKYIISDVKKTTPYDVTITRVSRNPKEKSIKDELLNNGFDLDEIISSTSEVKLYKSNNVNLHNFNLSNNKDILIMGIKDYNSARKMQGLNEIYLKNNEFAINCPSNELGEIKKKYREGESQYIQINNKKLNLSRQDIYDVVYHTSVMMPTSTVIVIPDKFLKDLNEYIEFLNCNYIKSNNYYDNMFLNKFFKFKQKHKESHLVCDTKISIDGEKIALNTAFSFSAIYIGIILLISAGAVLALQQLSESNSNKARFKLLRKLGVNNKNLRRATFINVSILFGSPLILAVIHSIFVSNVLYELLPELKSVGLVKSTITSVILVIVIYGIYYVISLLESFNIINKK